jgi:hypothetical protein
MSSLKPIGQSNNTPESESTPVRRHRIVVGPLAGLQGIHVEQRMPSRVLMAVDSLTGVFIEIDESQLGTDD